MIPALAHTRRLRALVGILVLVAVGFGLFHQRLNRWIAVAKVLRSESPRDEDFEACAARLPNPVAFLERCWATGKIPQRELVIAYLRDREQVHPSWFGAAEPLLLAGAVDPDLSVREVALAILQARGDPHLLDCARAQVTDPDPLVRELGLNYLRRLDARQGVPIVIRLLDDPDLRVAAGAEVALMHWTGVDFGVRIHNAVAAQHAADQLQHTNQILIRQGIQLRKAWWRAHTNDYPAVSGPAPRLPIPSPLAPVVEDFSLRDLHGAPVRLSQFRGKPVLLNFWATWCTACLAEIPDLIALQKQMGDRVVILGIALDSSGDEADADSVRANGGAASRAVVLQKVARAVTQRGINYPVLLDPTAMVGRRFNGGELPTTVIIDAEGRLRRRFIGERTVPVFEAMLAEAAKSE